jgi:Leucine-rich repeat (LRR) protein
MKKILLLLLILFSISDGNVTAQTVAVPDAVFLNFLKTNYPQTINASNQLIISQAALVTGNINCQNLGISSIEGIQYFTSISEIHAYGNNLTSMPDLSSIPSLTYLLVYKNQLNSLPALNNNPLLQQIIAYHNNLTFLSDISNLPSLQKIDVGQNNLTALPALNNNTAFQEITCWANAIKTIPPITNLVNLTKLNAGNNLLTASPDLSNNKQLSILDLNNNYLTKGPDLSGMQNLTSVKLYGNYLSFEDLIPYTSIFGFDTAFTLSPMKIFKGDTLDGYFTDPVPLITGIDHSLSNVQYTWKTSVDSLGTVSNDTFMISKPTGSTIIYCYATLTDPSIPNLQIITDSFLVRFHPCPQSSDLTSKGAQTNCGESGTVSITINGYVSPSAIYTLTDTESGISQSYSKDTITGLNGSSYTIQASLSSSCLINKPQPVVLSSVNCIETYITPHTPGDHSSYLIDGTGKAVIYDKNGQIIQRVSLPYEWKGTGQNTALVPVGYYVIDVNDGQQLIRISVLY